MICFHNLQCLTDPANQAGHNALSSSRLINDFIGITLHTFVLTPYYAWRVTHSTHHVWFSFEKQSIPSSHEKPWQKSTNNLERDETYIPPTRKDLKLPDGKIAVKMDYTEVLEETPAFTLFKMFVRQFL